MAQEDNNDIIILPVRRKKMRVVDFVKLNYIYDAQNPDKSQDDVAKDLLDTNRTFIWSQYTENDKKNEEERSGKFPTSADDLDINSYLPYPAALKVNPNNIKAEIAIVQSNLQVNTNDYVAFLDEKIQDIMQDEGYEVEGSEGSMSKQSPACTVIGWFKSSYNFGTGSKGTAGNINASPNTLQWHDISKYVIAMNISVTSNGGTFTIKLPIIRRKNFRASNWYQVEDPENLSSVGVNYDADRYGWSPYYAKVNQNIPYLKDYFSWLISNNDLLLLSMERLEMEATHEWFEKENGNAGKSSYGDAYEFKDYERNLHYGVYDMIGLVDSVRVVTNEENASAYVEITGRDLMKLLLDDGSFFFNISTASEGNKLFANYNDSVEGDMKGVDFLRGFTANPMRRLRRLGGEIDVFANAINKDIDFVIKGVLSQLSNIEVVPGELFDSWGDERTKFTHLEPKKQNNNG
jgi:hypothetical protein